MKRFILGLTLMASSMISLAIILAAYIISDYSVNMTSGLWVTLNRKGLVPVFWLLVIALCLGTLLALLPERPRRQTKENQP